jgi:hypothetical protein
VRNFPAASLPCTFADPRSIHFVGARGILAMQRGAGNRAVQRRLNVGRPNDPLEYEADRIAAAVVSGARPPSAPLTTIGAPRHTPEPGFASRLGAAAPHSFPLSSSLRARIEPVLGADLSGVRLHTGAAAAALSRSLNAQAFTCGSHIYFDRGRYAPNCASGLELLAHETAHVVQQRAPAAIRRRINIPEGDDVAGRHDRRNRRKEKRPGRWNGIRKPIANAPPNYSRSATACRYWHGRPM